MQMELVLFTGLPILVRILAAAPLTAHRSVLQRCTCSETLPLWLCRAVCVRVLGMCALHGRCVNVVCVSYSLRAFDERE